MHAKKSAVQALFLRILLILFRKQFIFRTVQQPFYIPTVPDKRQHCQYGNGYLERKSDQPRQHQPYHQSIQQESSQRPDRNNTSNSHDRKTDHIDHQAMQRE